MHIVAGTFSSQSEAGTALRDLEHQGVAPVSMRVIEPEDSEGFERAHRATRAAALKGAGAGALFGIVVFSVLLAIAGKDLLTLRYFAIYACGISLTSLGGAIILAFWNMGNSHDEALLYEEAAEKRSVIAAIEVDEPMEEQVIHVLEDHGARNVRTGNWHPRGWGHEYPAY